jgi:CheY-like chemotaxis protein
MATVLVVDDEPGIRLLLQLELDRQGHRVLEAGDGTEALDMVSRERPDAVVLDVMMPKVDGWAVLTELKADPDPEIRRIPVILLTALAEPLDRAKGGIEGAVRYLTKPLDLEDLHAAVDDALAGPEAAQRRRAQEQALELLARLERNAPVATGPASPRPRLSRLERGPAPSATAPPPGSTVRPGADRLSTLTDKQRELLDALRRAPTVMEAASTLGMSRSNIYASLRRISRKLGVHSVTELLDLVRHGGLVP